MLKKFSLFKQKKKKTLVDPLVSFLGLTLRKFITFLWVYLEFMLTYGFWAERLFAGKRKRNFVEI
jgi:hypothetical protein